MTERGPYMKTAAVRQQILNACTSVFAERGYHGLTMAEVARRADMSYTGLSHHFRRKEDLLTAVLKMQDQETSRLLSDPPDEFHDSDPAAKLKAVLGTMLGRRQDRVLLELSVVLAAEATSPRHPAHDFFADRYAVVRRFLRRQFGELESAGRTDPGFTPDQMATLTVAAVDGLQTQWLYEREIGDIDSTAASLLSKFVPELARL